MVAVSSELRPMAAFNTSCGDPCILLLELIYISVEIGNQLVKLFKNWMWRYFLRWSKQLCDVRNKYTASVAAFLYNVKQQHGIWENYIFVSWSDILFIFVYLKALSVAETV